MSNALHDYAKLFERYAANNGGTGVILEGEDCLSLANEMWMDADVIEAENAKLRMLIDLKQTCWKYVGWCSECPYNGLDDEHDDCSCTVREKVNSLVRELGIEVDE